jgi:hypothetical protein
VFITCVPADTYRHISPFRHISLQTLFALIECLTTVQADVADTKRAKTALVAYQYYSLFAHSLFAATYPGYIIATCAIYMYKCMYKCTCTSALVPRGERYAASAAMPYTYTNAPQSVSVACCTNPTNVADEPRTACRACHALSKQADAWADDVNMKVLLAFELFITYTCDITLSTYHQSYNYCSCSCFDLRFCIRHHEVFSTTNTPAIEQRM